jgi:hypothetical protein
MTKHQHGFSNKRSCLTNLLETLEEWTKAKDAGNNVDIIFLDFKKAFDTVPHGRLLHKLQSYGISGNLLNWIRNFLVGREMRVIVNGQYTEWNKVRSGVPQGSVLGPLLFLLYVNDLPDTISSSVKLFADDTKLWREIKSKEDSEELRQDLGRLNEWAKKWLLSFNISKCHVMHIGSGIETYSLQDGDNAMNLEIVTMEKDLGVWLCDDIKWSIQCRKAAKKAMSVLGMINRSFTKLNGEGFMILYRTYVRPHLEYCVQAWSPFQRKDILELEKVQRRATKLVSGLRHLTYEQRLQKLNMCSLEKRRLRGDLIEAFKLLNGKEDVDPNQFFVMAPTGHLRGHCKKIYKRRSRLEGRRNFFSQRVVKEWNELPEGIVNSGSIDQFKRNLDELWRCGH